MPITASTLRPAPTTPAYISARARSSLNSSFVRGPAKQRTRPSHRSRRVIKAEQNSSVEWHDLELKHVIESQQFSQAALAEKFATATEMESVKRGTPAAKQLEGYIMSTLFYEPSTRTRLSFESAMSRLGGTVLSTESAGEYSSAAKGETLEGAALHTGPQFVLNACAVLDTMR